MAVKTSFFCKACGMQHSKWQGQCNSCKEWNTLFEELIENKKEKNWNKNSFGLQTNRSIQLENIDEADESRILTSDKELNRVLGGGIVPGSLTLLGGEPGVGKSTLLLQIAITLEFKTLYISGEESQKQIKLRATRMNLNNKNSYVLSENKIKNVFNEISKLNPELVIIDSIQTLQSDLIDSSAGSVSQIRECSSEMIKYAKQTGTAVFLIGHINKDGAIAGPKILEHMVDTVLQFEGDRNHVYRILRTIKNRFGSASELGVYEMSQDGLREVNNPSEILISDRDEDTSGVAIASTIEGARPLMIEIQSLVSSAVYGTPQRSATGFDTRRLNMLLAVLEKRCGFRLGVKDVFLNITGGIKPDDTAIDLAVICSVLSSDQDLPIGMQTCFAAEVGLSGEIRAVNRIEQRIAEAEKLGYKQIIVSKFNKFNTSHFKIEVKQCSKIEEVFQLLF